MRVLITHTPSDVLDEVDVSRLRVGNIYDLPAQLASALILNGCAEHDMRIPVWDKPSDADADPQVRRKSSTRSAK